MNPWTGVPRPSSLTLSCSPSGQAEVWTVMRPAPE